MSDETERAVIGEVLALTADYDGCHQRIRDWEAQPEWERIAHPDEEPMMDREDAEFWNIRADAILTSDWLAEHDRKLVEATAKRAAEVLNQPWWSGASAAILAEFKIGGESL